MIDRTYDDLAGQGRAVDIGIIGPDELPELRVGDFEVEMLGRFTNQLPNCWACRHGIELLELNFARRVAAIGKSEVLQKVRGHSLHSRAIALRAILVSFQMLEMSLSVTATLMGPNG